MSGLCLSLQLSTLPHVHLVEIMMPHVTNEWDELDQDWKFAYQRNYESLNERMTVKNALCVYIYSKLFIHICTRICIRINI